MNDKLEKLEKRLMWIEDAMGNIGDMPTYNVISDIHMALHHISDILKDMQPKPKPKFKNFLYQGVTK